MKHNIIVFGMVALCCATELPVAADDIVSQPQSTHPTNRLFRSFSIMAETDDFRYRFAESEFIDGLLSRKTCFLYMAGLYFNSKRELIPIDKAEIPVTDQLTVAAVLRQVGMAEWKGGQPQIKLIQSNRILQSPLIRRNDKDREDQEAFLQARVYPGDILYCAILE